MTVVATGDALTAELRRRGITDVDDSTLTRALYSADASLYRVVPRVVARPRHTDELDPILEVARETGTPLTMRGSGTSIAGNAVGEGIVVDTRRHLGRVLDVDPDAGTATVEPGVVHADLQRVAAPHGLRFGPDPSTHTRCTIGGMIGNNACGSRALGYGRTSDNVVGLDVLFGNGEAWSGGLDTPSLVPHDGYSTSRGADGPEAGRVASASERVETTDRLAALADEHLAHIRTHFGQFSRQGSGYALERLLPERRSLDRFLVGSEGTLGLVRRATVTLVPEEPRLLLALGYPSMAEAADAVPALLAAAGDSRLIACEGLDSRIVDLVRAKRAVPELPRGSGWLLAEVGGTDAAAAVPRLVDAAAPLAHRVVGDAAEAAALWRIREDGAGLAARSLEKPAHAGWEDAAVPPENLGAWLRDFDEMLAAYGLHGIPYGHFGDGCVHVRIDFTFDDGGVRFREFLEACARRVAEYGGSISGEHGDGRARSGLLSTMYDEESLRLFGAVKAICDPDRLLNPGVLVDPAPVDADLRPARKPREIAAGLRLVHDDGSLGAAAHRCTGVGRCVVAAPSAGGVMCPSYQATAEEKDSTRGRARVLQEALDGSLVDGLADPALHEALDLCLSCKGCLSDCPTGVDMAAYKAEVLYQTYSGKRRPRSHYTLGRLPRWAALTAPFAGVANRMLRRPALARAAKSVAGVDRRRSLPQFASTTLRRQRRRAADDVDQPDVWLWPDSFTDHFSPGTAQAAIRLLGAAGLRAEVIDESACCGLTWISTGQLDQARDRLRGAISALAPYVDSGVPVVGLEPSCLATLRSEVRQLMASDDAAAVGDRVLSLAELLTRLADQGEWTPPDLTGVRVVAQPHCHQASVLGFDVDEALLRRAGAEVVRVPGCCGLAGNFGMERGHYETSVAVAETHLLPAVREHPDAVMLADGMSCRLQLSDLAGIRARHLSELLADSEG